MLTQSHIVSTGWMQLVILIYNMTGADSNLQIYNHVRVLISAYLFLSGYGHFYYLWHRNDAGIIRFFQVLLQVRKYGLVPVFVLLAFTKLISGKVIERC